MHWSLPFLRVTCTLTGPVGHVQPLGILRDCMRLCVTCVSHWRGGGVASQSSDHLSPPWRGSGSTGRKGAPTFAPLMSVYAAWPLCCLLDTRANAEP